MAEFWSNRQTDSGPVGGSERPAQEPSPDPRHPVQHAPTGSGEINTHAHTHTHKHNHLILHPAMSDISSSPQRVALSFDFPFYGHYLRQIIVATGGEFHFALLDIIATLIYVAPPIRRSNIQQCTEGDSVLPWGNIQAYQAIINPVNCKCLHFLMTLIA